MGHRLFEQIFIEKPHLLKWHSANLPVLEQDEDAEASGICIPAPWNLDSIKRLEKTGKSSVTLLFFPCKLSQ